MNILRGTYSTGNAPARGLNVPIVATPFGFNYWVPTTDGSTDNTPYAYSGAEARFKGIKISHVASNWIGESGTYYFSADSTTTDYSAVGNAIRNRGSVFSHENEIAKPYYYGVTLTSWGSFLKLPLPGTPPVKALWECSSLRPTKTKKLLSK